MRTRQEIIDGMSNNLNAGREAEAVLGGAVIEILLDIRDLLTNKESK